MHGSHVAKLQAHRKMSLGPMPVRRACPASGASWNVQVVRGKMTSKCLWHACQALALGFLLMVIGAGMATIGYFAEHIADNKDVKDNATVPLRSESKGVNLHNLSYAGPIVMGFGGFIIVAACVMTFEARDSASKVVPARFKINYGKHDSSARSSNADRRPTGLSTSTALQTNRLENDSKSSSLDDHPSCSNREQQTALVHGSKECSRTSDGVHSTTSKAKSQPFRAQSAVNQIDTYVEQKSTETQTSTSDVAVCHVNERKPAKASGKRPSSLKLPEQSKSRAKHLYRSRTKPEEPTKLTDFHLDGNVDDIFVISRDLPVKHTPK